jgi:glycine cleavage system H protein
VGGEIIEINKAAANNPALVNREPFAGGWFFKIKLANVAEVSAMLSPEQYKTQING